MLRVGQEEIDAIGQVIRSQKLFRYAAAGAMSQCDRFEKRYSEYLGVPQVTLTSSGTAALTAALAGVGIGPGDEVIVPAHTYIATAMAVLAVGAIPVIVDIDESIMLSPEALEDAIGPCTKAFIPVHMWGHACNMNALMEIAARRNLIVVEDACQGVGGSYEGKKLGSFGQAAAYSFNYFKNMTCGEGGAVVTHEARAAQIARCMVDSCGFFWKGKENDLQPFASNGSRASELAGAMMNSQLDRIDGIIQTLRTKKKRILQGLAGAPNLKPSPNHSPDHECATNIFLQLPTAEAATAFAKQLQCPVVGRTGRHTFNEWDPILNHRAGHHPALNPYHFDQNKKCRKDYPPDLCRRSLAILNRSVLLTNVLDRTDEQDEQLIQKIKAAAA